MDWHGVCNGRRSREANMHGFLDNGALIAERRLTARPRALKSAHIRFNKGFSAYEAIVRDISKGGARLRFGDFVDVPGRFEMRIRPDEEWRGAVVCWRQGFDVGVRFSS
jgi:hypothetical protein